MGGTSRDVPGGWVVSDLCPHHERSFVEPAMSFASRQANTMRNWDRGKKLLGHGKPGGPHSARKQALRPPRQVITSAGPVGPLGRDWPCDVSPSHTLPSVYGVLVALSSDLLQCIMMKGQAGRTARQLPVTRGPLLRAAKAQFASALHRGDRVARDHGDRCRNRAVRSWSW